MCFFLENVNSVLYSLLATLSVGKVVGTLRGGGILISEDHFL